MVMMIMMTVPDVVFDYDDENDDDDDDNDNDDSDYLKRKIQCNKNNIYISK